MKNIKLLLLILVSLMCVSCTITTPEINGGVDIIYPDNEDLDNKPTDVPEFPSPANPDDVLYEEAPDSLEGLSEDDIKDLSALKKAFDNIGENYLSKTKVYFNELAIDRVNKIYSTNFYCNQTTIFNQNYIYRYSSDFVINQGYVNYNSNVYTVSLEGADEKAKLSSTINPETMELLYENKSITECYFTLGDINTKYVDDHGPTTVKYTSSYSKDYLGWTRIGVNKYKCDRE